MELRSSILRLAYRWGPVLFWMAGISYFSSRSYPLGPLSRSEHSDVINRVAHFAEYAGLAALLHRAAAEGGREHRASWVSLVVSLAYAIFDELHQKFVPGRGFELADVGYDLAGAIVALGLIWVWSASPRRRHVRR
ncbi:MAG TPA: VanZ family protein [Anaerolineae bacterium]|nr:VanZ family protein [Anaerolineae bacterium]